MNKKLAGDVGRAGDRVAGPEEDGGRSRQRDERGADDRVSVWLEDLSHRAPRGRLPAGTPSRQRH